MENTAKNTFTETDFLFRNVNGASLCNYPGNKHAVVIMIDNRFYYKHTSDRILTAWSLAGAKLFIPNSPDEIEKVIEKIKSKGKKYALKVLSF